MTLEWRNTQDGVDWDELAGLYRAAPLGDKKATELKIVFTASLFKCFVYDAGQLVGAGRVLADGFDAAYPRRANRQTPRDLPQRHPSGRSEEVENHSAPADGIS